MYIDTSHPVVITGEMLFSRLAQIQQQKQFLAGSLDVVTDLGQMLESSAGQEVYGITDDTPLSVFRDRYS